MGAACLSHGFLGFSFGQHLEDDEEKDPLKEAFNEARKVQYKQDFENAEVLYHKALKVTLQTPLLFCSFLMHFFHY